MSEKTGKSLISEQLQSVLPDAETDIEPSLFADLVPERVSGGKEYRRAVGRPKGALNKATMQNKEYCLRRGYMSFLDIVGSAASMLPTEIASVYGVDIEMASRIWMFCVDQYGRYTERQAPKQIEAQVEQKVAVVKKYVVDDQNVQTIEMAENRDFQRVEKDDV